MSDWIGRAHAMTQLGVRAQTLYAYVSRGWIGARPDPADPRRSLYAASDIDRLAARQKRPRKAGAIAAGAISWGEPSIPTRLSTIDRGRLIYRGEDAVALSATATLEEIAALLWEQAAPPHFAEADHGAFASPFAALADLAVAAPASLHRSPTQLGIDGARGVARLASGFGLPESDDPLHARLAAAWRVDATGADLLRQALVLIADHDLNASTFTVRVAASTGASIAACLLAGLATLSGPRHGAAGASLAMLVGQAERHGITAALDQWLAAGHELQAFGHMLYPQGDVRAVPLLDRLTLDPVMARLRDAVREVGGQPPNIDFALCALARALALPDDAPFVLFALGRSVGWVAHAIEQVTTGSLIRPRGRYDGAMPTAD
ncbi:citrate synthase [Sphingobium nicotianae]|uniref:citrate synthase (unknown stereospecificity) n=1 Tax=Sphingobium nicotianae TaxID=2782607 RepID=A0A9X1DF27_9SPHN|nr:citrate synthase [Sphingobium nicotianae]MBT2188765.1 citrate synthase [Sphingobium nicotianae]